MQSDITIAAVQTSLRFYTTVEQFDEHMRRLVGAAAAHQPDLIVLPEDMGTGLLALGAPEKALAAKSTFQVGIAVMSVKGAEVMAMAGRGASLTAALLLAQASVTRETYIATFAALARETGAHIAAGTVLLPHEHEEGIAVYNTALLFGPDGETVGSADKVNLIPTELEEGLGLTPGDPAALEPWPTPPGTLAPVICADAWDAELVSGLVARGAQLLVCPSANPEPWTEEVRLDRLDGLHARVRELQVPAVECFAVGSLAGRHFEGRTWIIAPDGDGGVEVLAQADDAVGESIVVATVELPPPRA